MSPFLHDLTLRTAPNSLADWALTLMRLSSLLTSASIALFAMTTSIDAQADSMDPALGRLVLDENCRTSNSGGGDFYNPASQFRRCRPNHAAFAKLIAQYGFALAPLAQHTARTTGFGGYRFGISGSYTSIDSDAPYWKQGTQGAADETTGRASIENISPDDILQVYSIHLAKGFPFGLELGAGFGYLVNTEIITGGGDVRISLFEGFRESVPGFIPDVGVGGGVRTITGTSEFKLTVAAFDATISKPIPIAGTVSIHPHIGYQLLWIFGDSGLIDLTPNTDPVTHCGYRGDDNPATSPGDGEPGFDGQPVCSGSSADFNNNVVFQKAHFINRHRMNVGAALRYQMIWFGLHFLFEPVSPLSANGSGDSIVQPEAIDPSESHRQLDIRAQQARRRPAQRRPRGRQPVDVRLGARCGFLNARSGLRSLRTSPW